MAKKLFKTGKLWAIGARKHAISSPAEAVALAYGPNVSKGILKMEERIVELEHKLKKRVP
ncbi:MAG: hypothetical protein PHT77_05460 [Bacteroidales bacterium]|nr:hypothetical protein [Bacteroidales bacterium]